VHVSVAVAVLFTQLAPPSGTPAVTVTVTVPSFVHVNVGDGEVVLLKVPPPGPAVTDQEKPTSELLPVLSIPCAERLTEPPTSTEDGLADSEVTAAHGSTTDTVPLMLTEPLLPASTLFSVQTRLSITPVVDPAVTVNAADPVQPTPVDVVAASVIVYPAPAGSPPTMNCTVALCDTSTVPLRSALKSAGLWIVQVTVSIDTPGATCRLIPTVPVFASVPPGGRPWLIEHAPMAALPARTPARRMVVFSALCRMMRSPRAIQSMDLRCGRVPTASGAREGRGGWSPM
jgi:hypothetical protein